MNAFLHSFILSVPLFLLVAAGYAAMKVLKLPKLVAKVVSQIVFSFALPVLLFHTMSGFRSISSLNWRILVAFFGGCFVVFALGQFFARRLALTGASRSVFAIGGVFSNNVMLGLPLARILLGDAAVPTVALVLMFNAMILWTLVTISVEWARHGRGSPTALAKTLVSVVLNPIVMGIALGLLWSFTGWTLPFAVDQAMRWTGEAAGPLALLALGLGMAEYKLGSERKVTAAIAALKLLAHPLAVWILALLLGLNPLETKTLVLLASIAIGSNVYLMARQFGALEGPVAQSLLGSTILSAVTMPLLLGLVS